MYKVLSGCISHCILKNLDVESASLLDNVRQSLEQEALEIDKLKMNMTTGTRLVKEKEHKLQELNQLITEDGVS